MDSNLSENNVIDSLLTTYYMPRPRIQKILDQAVRRKLVYVIAGAGYGKTQAVRQYIEQQPDAIVRWVQLTENDNVGSHYWEVLTHNISYDNPGLAEKLREFGFPETLSRFRQFADILKTTEHRALKTYLVLDDFHLIHSRQALDFAERCANLHVPGACVIIISRTEPEINTISLFVKDKACTIAEDELRFTEEEVASFMKLRGVPFSARDLPKLIDATKGWALAIGLLSLALKRIPQNLELALDIMKQNIFKLMETEAWDFFAEDIRKILVRSALISDLPLKPLHEKLDETSFIRNAPQLAAFLWFDSLVGDYRVHPLYLEFLQSKQDILTDEEKQDTYKQAALWCSQNRLLMDAIKYYAKSRQYERVVETLLSYPMKLPHDICEYILTVLENLEPQGENCSDVSFVLLKNLFIPILLVGAGRFEEAQKRSFETIREWERLDTKFSAYLLYTVYGNLTYINFYNCTVTHKYDSPKYIKKSIEYYKLSSKPPIKGSGSFTIADIRSFACLVGEGASLSEFDEFLESTRETAYYFTQTSHNMYYGYDDLVACELAFYKNQLEEAKSYAHQAVFKAREKNQHSIEAMAVFYQFRVAVQEGDYLFIKELLKQGHNNSGNPNFWNRQFLSDLGVSFLYAHIGHPKTEPAWLSTDENESAYAVSIPVIELICGARYYFALKKYDLALSLLCNSYPRKPYERFLFGELTISLLTAVARIRTGDDSGAVEDFKKAYSLSFDGVFEMPFIELGKELHPLINAALKQAECGFPEEWLKTMYRKASVWAKKTMIVLNSFKKEKRINDNIQLSEREQEVLNDLYHGLSREEMAENRYLSVNTVKKILLSIYSKLDAGNNVDAIRIGLEKKLIK